MSLNRFHVVSPIALIAFSACRSPYTPGGSVGGAVVNGPLDSALVFLDYDFDGVLDANEPNVRTNQFGEYQLTATSDFYDLVAIADDQTVDSSSGATFAGITLKAPSGAGVISPTSTLMQEGNLTASEVAEVLGLPDGIDPLSFNPFNVDENDATAVAQALEVAKISKQITTAISSFASATEGAGADAADAFNTALNSVVDVVKAKAVKAKDANSSAADKIIDFTATTDLDLIKIEVTTKAADLKGLDRATLNSLSADTTAAVKNVNDKIKAVTDLSSDATKDIFSTTQVLRDQIKDVAVARKEGKAGDITFKNLAAVETAMSNKAPSAITLSGDRLVTAEGELVVGTVATIDSDPGDTTFTYTLAGNDAAFFDFDASSGELSLKAAPNYANKPYYEITIITKDEGGKKFAETFIIDVVPEFGALGDPDQIVASDFDTIMKQNPLFKQMSSEVQLKQTSDGQLVLMEVTQSGGYGSTSGSQAEGPIVAFIKITDEGYALHNPATDEYMGGFFTYTQGDLTYTGYEVLVDDMSVLAKYDADLTKYFDPDSTYGTGKLTYTARDIEYVAIVGAKAVDKNGTTVQDMLGFSHYDKNMDTLGSAGIDVTNSSAPYYIEVVGEYDPAVSTNITSTAITDASVAQAMQTLLNNSGEAVLYGVDTNPPDVPVISNSSVVINNPFPTISGTAEVSSTVEVFKDGISIGKSITNQNGDWSFLISEILESGTYAFTATATDSVGNVSGSTEITNITLLDTEGPILTDFDLNTTNLLLGEEIKIEFKATDQTYVGFLNATFSHESNPSSKINVKAQNTENTNKISDHFDFLLNSSNFYELNIPLIIEDDLKSGNYNLESLSLSDANTNTNPVLNNETIYNSVQLDNQNAKFFDNLESENKTLVVSIPVLNDNLVLPEINEVESNARLDLANQVLPDNIIKGDVWPTGEDWFKFDLIEPGTIIAQMDIGTGSADLKLYGPDEIEIISKRISEVGMIHHTTSDMGEYYLLIGDGNVNRLEYELIIDVV